MGELVDLLLQNRQIIREYLMIAMDPGPRRERDEALCRALRRLSSDLDRLAAENLLREMQMLDVLDVFRDGVRKKDLRMCEEIGDLLDNAMLNNAGQWPPPPARDYFTQLYIKAYEVIESGALSGRSQAFGVAVGSFGSQVRQLQAKFCERVPVDGVRERDRRRAMQALVRGWLVLQLVGLAAGLPGDLEDVWHRTDDPRHRIVHALVGPGMHVLTEAEYPPLDTIPDTIARMLSSLPPADLPRPSRPPAPRRPASGSSVHHARRRRVAAVGRAVVVAVRDALGRLVARTVPRDSIYDEPPALPGGRVSRQTFARPVGHSPPIGEDLPSGDLSRDHDAAPRPPHGAVRRQPEADRPARPREIEPPPPLTPAQLEELGLRPAPKRRPQVHGEDNM